MSDQVSGAAVVFEDYRTGGIGMILLGTAQKLKEAGLKWERPIEGDFYVWKTANTRVFSRGGLSLISRKMKGLASLDDLIDRLRHEATWLQRLDQLLAEIEKHGYWWELMCKANDQKNIFVAKDYGTEWQQSTSINADTSEDAAAAALLWILDAIPARSTMIDKGGDDT
jgi:hypothetical protein